MNIWKLFGTLLIAVSLLGLAGCNTTQGLGQDLQEVGEEIEDEVDDHT